MLCIASFSTQTQLPAALAPSSTNGPKAAVDPHVVLARMTLLHRRCAKLHDLFTTIKQFADVRKHKHLQGIPPLVEAFDRIVASIQVSPWCCVVVCCHSTIQLCS